MNLSFFELLSYVNSGIRLRSNVSSRRRRLVLGPDNRNIKSYAKAITDHNVLGKIVGTVYKPLFHNYGYGFILDQAHMEDILAQSPETIIKRVPKNYQETLRNIIRASGGSEGELVQATTQFYKNYIDMVNPLWTAAGPIGLGLVALLSLFFYFQVKHPLKIIGSMFVFNELFSVFTKNVLDERVMGSSLVMYMLFGAASSVYWQGSRWFDFTLFGTHGVTMTSTFLFAIQQTGSSMYADPGYPYGPETDVAHIVHHIGLVAGWFLWKYFG